jgi:hypothetical protein
MSIFKQKFSKMKTFQLAPDLGPGHAGLQLCHPDKQQILSQGVSIVQYLSSVWRLDEKVPYLLRMF